MRLLPPFSEDSYITVKALIEDVNKTASSQGYKPSAFDVAAARPQNRAPGQRQVGNSRRNFWGRGRGRAQGEVRVRNPPHEDQPRRAGLRHRVDPKEET